jgi:hypothetical protein
MRCDAQIGGTADGSCEGLNPKMRMGDGVWQRDSRTLRHSPRTQCSEHAFGGTGAGERPSARAGTCHIGRAIKSFGTTVVRGSHTAEPCHGSKSALGS